MGKTTEGMILTSSQQAEDRKFQAEIDQSYLRTSEMTHESLLKISRQQFVEDVKKALGDISETLPVDVKQVLENLLNSTQLYMTLGQDIAFLALCQEALKRTGQGWGYLSYWVSSEQSRCYSIYWRLKAAVEKHQRRMKMFKHPKNDGVPPNDASMPILPPEPQVAARPTMCSYNHNHKTSHFIERLGSTAKKMQNNFFRRIHSNGFEVFRELFEIKNGWSHQPATVSSQKIKKIIKTKRGHKKQRNV